MTVERHPIVSRQQWLALRLNDVTASDVAAVCGEDPRRTPLSVFAEKRGLSPGKAETAIMRRGRYFEGAVFEALRDLKPKWQIKRAKIYLRDPERRIGATPDGLAIAPEREGTGNVQAKVVARSVYERDWIEGAPLTYQLQTLTEAMLIEGTGAVELPVWAVIAALVVSEFEAELHLVEVPRNPAAEQRIRREIENFWKTIDAGEQPRADYRRDGRVLDTLYPRETHEIDLTGDNEMPTLIDAYLGVVATIGELEAEKAEFANKLKDKLGAAAVAQCLGGRRVTWKTMTRKEHVVPEWSGRVLRVYGEKHDEK